MTTASAGWRSDPTARHEYRFWDGANWTDEVSDGGSVSSDPLDQPGVGSGPADDGADHRFATPDGPPPPLQPLRPPETPPEDPPGLRSSTDQTPRPGPSTSLLVGLSMLVVGLAVAIVLVLVTDDGGDSSTTTTEGDGDETSPTTDGSQDEDNEFQLDVAAEQMVDDFSGEITVEEARCMLRSGEQAGSERGYTDESFEELTEEDQLAVMNAMLGCVDARTVLANLLAQGMVAGEGVEQSAAQCAADRIVDSVSMDSLLLAIISQAQDPLENLTSQEQSAVQDAVVDCGV